MTMVRVVDTALIGLGNVNRSFLRILERKSERLQRQHGFRFRVVCVADSSGVAVRPAGFDPVQLRKHKEAGGHVSDLESYLPGKTPVDVLSAWDGDLVLEASPVNLETGEPGLSVVQAALQRGIPVVLANKGPLVLAFDELHTLAAASGAGLGFSATVCGALPIVNIGRRDHIADDITLLRGILNATSNVILDEMASGRSYHEALRLAQEHGIAEADPSLDVGGWDTANKLVIIANSFLGTHATLSDLKVEGITHITPQALQAEQAQGNCIKLLAVAELTAAGYHLWVKPTVLPRTDFLAQCHGFEMGVEIHSDLYGKMYHKIWEDTALPTAAAMLRDAVNLLTRRESHG